MQTTTQLIGRQSSSGVGGRVRANGAKGLDEFPQSSDFYVETRA